jgi:predicted metal-dependent enzyme (double-stranded beta helix superfamily)
VFDKDRFVEDCLQAIKESNPEAAVKELVERAIASPGEIEAAIGTPSEGGLHRLYVSPELTVLNVVWAPLMTLYPHNHNCWAVIGIYGGAEDNRFYRRRAEGVGLEEVNGRSLQEQETIVLGERAIHGVHNPRRAYTGALHIYGADFFSTPRSEWESPEAPEQPYSVERTMATFVEANARAEELLRTAQ